MLVIVKDEGMGKGEGRMGEMGEGGSNYTNSNDVMSALYIWCGGIGCVNVGVYRCGRILFAGFCSLLAVGIGLKYCCLRFGRQTGVV
jgi:hypothetical protein